MISDFYEECTRIIDQTESDGLGGIKHSFQNGAVFSAAIYADSSTAMQIAERNGMKTIYTVITPNTVRLQRNDLIKRMKTGKIMRITSDAVDFETPSVTNLNLYKMTAEVFE